MVALDPGAVGRNQDRHRGEPRHHLVQQALALGIQVSHDHEGHAGLLRHAAEKPLLCLAAAGGGAAADDRYHRISGHCGT